MNPLRRLFRFLDGFRRVVLNLLFFGLLFAILAAIIASRPPSLKERTTLVIDADAVVVEESTGSGFDRFLQQLSGSSGPTEIQLRDLVAVIEAAAADPKIERLYLKPRGLQAGVATAREIARALAKFRAAGKPILAYADALDQLGYHLAAQADEIWLHPMGGVILEGFGRYRLYYREALEDKLSLDVHLFRAGEYKSFGEPYTRDGASEEAKEADAYVLNGRWRTFLADLAERRGIEAENLSALIEGFPERLIAEQGDLARLALSAGLVDELLSEDQAEAKLKALGVPDEEGKSFRRIGFDDYLRIVKAQRGREALAHKDEPTVAIVVAMGSIMEGEQPAGSVGGVSTAALLRKAREDEKVKAVVLRVDSPGGSAFASEQIRREVELLKEAGKPVVASMGNVAASGGYWISMSADRIIADPTTITGSIGVIGLFMTAPRLLERLGVRSDGVGTTSWAGALDPARPFDPRLKPVFERLIAKSYRDFLEGVAKGRGTTPEAVDAIARGRIWSGEQALERGLVDELGGLEDAVRQAAALAKLDRYQVRYVERDAKGLARFLKGLETSRLAGWLERRLGVAASMPAAPNARLLRELERDLGYVLRGQKEPFAVHAYCFCGFD
ncbi:MAG: protease [Lysobacterales bacterium]|jgi:protease-4|nr:MAG: protease [Xanthomonadales bacterium]